MSKFFTPFVFPLEEIKELLPAGAHLESVFWNKEKSQVELHWDYRELTTGFDFAHEFQPEALNAFQESGRLPEGIHQGRKLPKPRLEAMPTEPAGEIPMGTRVPSPKQPAPIPSPINEEDMARRLAAKPQPAAGLKAPNGAEEQPTLPPAPPEPQLTQEELEEADDAALTLEQLEAADRAETAQAQAEVRTSHDFEPKPISKPGRRGKSRD